MYAVREVAKYRDDVAIRNRITVEILLLSVILCLFGYVAVAVLGIYVPQISAQLGVFYALSLTILFTSLGVNWFYQAVEDLSSSRFGPCAFACWRRWGFSCLQRQGRSVDLCPLSW